jgi:hypothetical protein
MTLHEPAATRARRFVSLRLLTLVALLGALVAVPRTAQAAPVGVPPTSGTGAVAFWGALGVSPLPARLTGKTYIAIADGEWHSLELTSAGKVVAWGYDAYGQTDVPAALRHKTVTAIAAGDYHSLALTSDGKITAWGDDTYGQTDVPASLGGKTVTAIAAGGSHSLALTSDGTVSAWGHDQAGESDVPASLSGKTVTAIAAGGWYSMALTSDGKITEWGEDVYGRKVRVPDFLKGETVIAIAAGAAASSAIWVGPVIAPHGDMHQPATSSTGAVVHYRSPTATDPVDGTDPVSCRPASESSFRVGTSKVSCTSADSTGNTSTSQFKVRVNVAAVHGVSPKDGPLSGGQQVTVLGHGFTPTSKVYFGRDSEAASVQVVSPSQLEVISPLHAAGRVNIRVRTFVGAGGLSPVAFADRYTFTATEHAKTAARAAAR